MCSVVFSTKSYKKAFTGINNIIGIDWLSGCITYHHDQIEFSVMPSTVVGAIGRIVSITIRITIIIVWIISVMIWSIIVAVSV